MLKQLRQTIVNHLWQTYCKTTPQMRLIEAHLKLKNIHHLPLDHFAIIDLPGPETGIHHLAQIFSALGFMVQGRDYLPEKQNEFLWLTEIDSKQTLATQVLPQVVVADFWPQALPAEIRLIIEKYAQLSPPSPLREIHSLLGRVFYDDEIAAKKIALLLSEYFAGRDWPLPTVKEFQLVHEFNELLAWVLVFGRKPNHFTLAIHHLPFFRDLFHFHAFIEEEVKLSLNHEGGTIKGTREKGILQGSTMGSRESIALKDGNVLLPVGFVEFVWRYPHANFPTNTLPKKWEDFFTGFIAQHANHVIESLYAQKNA